MAVVYRYVGIQTVDVVVFRSRGVFHSLKELRASAANTPTPTTPEDVSHSRGRNVEGKES